MSLTIFLLIILAVGFGGLIVVYKLRAKEINQRTSRRKKND